MEPSKISNQPGKSAEPNSSSSKSKKKVGTIYGSTLLRQVSKSTGQSSHQVNQQNGQTPEQSNQPKSQNIVGQTTGQVGVHGSLLKGRTTQPGGQVAGPSSRTQVKVEPSSRAVTQSITPSTGQLAGQNVQLRNQSSLVSAAPQLCLKFVKSTQPDGKPGLSVVLQSANSNQQGFPQQNQAQLLQQQQRTLQPSHSSPAGAQHQQAPRYMSPTRVPVSAQSQRGKKKSVPVPSDETEQAVNALVATMSGTTKNEPREPRLGIWKPKSQVAKTQSQKQSPTEDPARKAQLVKALTTLLCQQKAQSQMPVRQEESHISVDQRRVSEPHQLPPDDDRLGIDESRDKSSKKKKKVKAKRLTESARREKLQQTAAYLKRLDAPHYNKNQETLQEKESREWSNMVKNIDVFMFPVYRCKLCPNYYSTVKKTVAEHMKKVHKWVYMKEINTQVGDGEQVTGNVQDKVKNIQKIFERKLRSQSGDLDHGLGLELEKPNDIVEVPFSSVSESRTGGDEELIARDHQSSDDGDDDPGGFEPMNDDDDDDVVANGRDDKNLEEESGHPDRSPELVMRSTTAMVRKYTHKSQTSFSALGDEDQVDEKQIDEKQTDEEMEDMSETRSPSTKGSNLSTENQTLQSSGENSPSNLRTAGAISKKRGRGRPKKNESQRNVEEHSVLGEKEIRPVSNEEHKDLSKTRSPSAKGSNLSAGDQTLQSEEENSPSNLIPAGASSRGGRGQPRKKASERWVEEIVFVEDKDLSEVKPKETYLHSFPKKVKDTRSKTERRLSRKRNQFKSGPDNIWYKRTRTLRNETCESEMIDKDHGTLSLGKDLDKPDIVDNKSFEVNDTRKSEEKEGTAVDDCCSEPINDSEKEVADTSGEDISIQMPTVLLKKLPFDKEKGVLCNPLDKEIGSTSGEDPSSTAKSKVADSKKRATTRSMARSQGGTDPDTNDKGANEKDESEAGPSKPSKWIRFSRYDAWKKIGLDPDSKPPWPCTQPGCTYKASYLSNILTHHIYKHDSFGDREQRKLARQLGERYSLFHGREKRAVDKADSDNDIDDTGDGTGTLKSKRKKKAPKRLSDNLIGENREFLPISIAKLYQAKEKREKLFRCPFCNKRCLSKNGLNTHLLRSNHKKFKMSGESANSSGIKEGESSSNMSLLADVAEEVGGEEKSLDCKHCCFKAKSSKLLRNHVDQNHPIYIRSRYSDSESEEDADQQTEDDDDVELKQSIPTLSSRPVRNCRRKQLPKMLAKEKKLDKVIPLILPHHSLYGQEIQERVEEFDEEDESYESGPLMVCQECGFVITTEYGFVRHMKKVHNQDIALIHKCDSCDFNGTRKELQSHKRNVHEEMIVCEVCGKSAKGERRLKMHQKFWCGKERPKRRKQQQNVKRTCKMCNKEFHTSSSYYYHMAGHKTEEAFQCSLCPKTFTRNTQLTSHFTIWHTDGRYECDHCPYKAHFKNTLKKHLFEKHDIGGEDFPVLNCNVEGCSYSTKMTSAMSNHKKRHDPTRFKYFCDGCNQPVKTLKSLAKHQVLHRDGITKYKCEECGHQATSDNSLGLHRAAKHRPQIKSLICDLCGATFKQAAHLKTHHMLHHSKVNPVKCKVCDQTFRYHYQMKKHFKLVHSEMAQAEEAAQMQEAVEIINAPPKERKKTVRVKKPRSRKDRKKKPPTGKKVGRPKVPLTPEVVARRKEQARIRNQKKHANRMAKLKVLGIKRKKYSRKNRGQRTGASNQKHHQTVTSVPFDDNQETANATHQLESIAQAFTTDPQSQEQFINTYSYQSRASDSSFPVKIIPAQTNYGQPTALQQEYDTRELPSTSTYDSYHYPPSVSREVVVGEQSRYESHHVEVPTSYTTASPQRVIQEVETDQTELVTHVGPQREGSSTPPANFLEVTTIQKDGSKKVEMWPIWNS